MNIFNRLITFSKGGKCENPEALKEKQDREVQARKEWSKGKRKIISFVENRREEAKRKEKEE